MEQGDWLGRIAEPVADGIELTMLLVLVVGTFRALKAIAAHVIRREALAGDVRAIWIHYAGWLVLALEFALAADLIGTVVAPSWSKIGQLAAIATIRTGLAWFLGRDFHKFGEKETTTDSSLESPA